MERRDLGLGNGDSRQGVPLFIAWAVIALPLGWGVAQTLVKALALFR
jgi:hypothetical protein